jgi:HlyD family secretion protein
MRQWTKSMRPKSKLGKKHVLHWTRCRAKFFPGKIRRIAPYVTEIEKQARTVDIEVDFLQVDGGYAAIGGLQRRCRSRCWNAEDDVLRIPTQAIRQDNKVWLVDTNDQQTERNSQLETGLSKLELHRNPQLA